jgi:hypothetical protein
MPFDLGAVVGLDWQATDVTGAPADAASLSDVSLSLTTPDGVTTLLTAAQALPPDQIGSATGWYYADYVTAQVGRHTIRWVATGTPGPGVGVGAHTDSFDVRSGTDDTIISLADAKRRLRITDDAYDDDVRLYLGAITGVVEKLAGCCVVRQVTDRIRAGGLMIALDHWPVYQPAGQAYPIISMVPVLTYGLVYDLSLLTVNISENAPGNFVRHTAGLPFIYGPYDFTYTVGRPVIPDNVMLSSDMILRHLWGMERSGNRSGMASPGDDTTQMWGFAIPNRALQLLDAPGTRDVGGIA